MAQSAITVTPPNPTPPTNMGFVGSTPPNPLNYDPDCYTNPPTETPPFFDAGVASTMTEFVSAHPSLPVGGTSVEHEGRGTEVVVVAPGSRPECPTLSFSCLGSFTSNPNAQHASSLSPAGGPTVTGLVPATTPSGAGTVALTVNGTNFTKQSVVYVNGIAQTTVFVGPTQLTVAAAPKRATPGMSPVKVVTAGAVESAPTNWTFT